MRKLFLIFISFYFISCSQTPEETITAVNSIHAPSVNVQLNAGEKWTANQETTQGINNMVKIVEGGLESEDPKMPKLKGALEQELKTIYAKCTMTGTAHDQLHNYLLPLKEKIDKVAESENKIILIELQSYLSVYPNYFQ